MAERIQCADKWCEGYMELGLASPSMRAAYTEQAMLESMAGLTGWQKQADDNWLCPEHRNG